MCALARQSKRVVEGGFQVKWLQNKYNLTPVNSDRKKEKERHMEAGGGG